CDSDARNRPRSLPLSRLTLLTVVNPVSRNLTRLPFPPVLSSQGMGIRSPVSGSMGLFHCGSSRPSSLGPQVKPPPSSPAPVPLTYTYTPPLPEPKVVCVRG